MKHNKSQRVDRLTELLEIEYGKGVMLGSRRKRRPEAGVKWRQLRRAVLHRDNHECKFPGGCQFGDTKRLHVHHIDKDPKNNKMDNLITLCSKCHRRTKH